MSENVARAAYCQYLEGTSRTREESAAEFDVWLAKERAAAIRKVASFLPASERIVAQWLESEADLIVRFEADRIAKEAQRD